jgi:hypothetical protein
MSTNYHIVKGFYCDGFFSLSHEYATRVINAEEESSIYTYYAVVNDLTYQELVSRSQNTFDYDYYFKLFALDADQQREKFGTNVLDYQETNGKAIITNSSRSDWFIELFKTEDEANQFLDEIVLIGTSKIVTKKSFLTNEPFYQVLQSVTHSDGYTDNIIIGNFNTI